MAFSPDGRFVAAGSGQGHVFLWDAASGKELWRVAAHFALEGVGRGSHDRRTLVAFSPDGALLASGSENDGTVKRWNVSTGKLVRSFGSGQDGYGDLVFSPQKGEWLAAAGALGADMAVRVWNPQTGELRQVLRGHTKPIIRLAFSPDGQRLAMSGEEAVVQVCDVRSGSEFGTYRCHSAPVFALAFTPDGRRILSLDWRGGLKHWDANHGPEALLIRQGDGAWDAALSRDGRRVAAAANDGAIYVWDAETGETQRKFMEQERAWSVAVSPDGGYLAAARGKIGAGGVSVWDLRTGALVRRLPDPAQGEGTGAPCVTVTFSPDGKRLAAGTQERVVHVWDVKTWREAFRLGEHGLTVSSVGFSPDGRWLVSASGGDLWPAPPPGPQPPPATG